MGIRVSEGADRSRGVKVMEGCWEVRALWVVGWRVPIVREKEGRAVRAGMRARARVPAPMRRMDWWVGEGLAEGVEDMVGFVVVAGAD